MTVPPSHVTGGVVGGASFSVLPEVSPLCCMALMLVSIVPMLLRVWREPCGNELEGYTICALASFLFGYHVHEKAILLVILPFTALALRHPDQYARFMLILSSAGYSGLLPLIYTPYEQPIVIGLFLVSQFFTFTLFLAQMQKCHLIEKLYIL